MKTTTKTTKVRTLLKFNSKIFLVIFFSLLLFVLSKNTVVAQDVKHCGTTEAMNELIKKNPDVWKKYLELEKLTADYIKSHENASQKTNGQIYIIPLVFHIIHQYGPENISDAQVFDAVKILNRDFRKLNADTSDILPQFKSVAADCEIEFRLAQKDPEGNCTNGIDRIYSYRTNFGDDNSKLNQWDRKKYLNIWVVNTIGAAGVAGYTTFPSGATGFNYVNDGIIILHDYVGGTGSGFTGNDNNSRALTHEVGHYLNLAHPWGFNNSPEVTCGDDGVNDTPVTAGWAHCPTINESKHCDTTGGGKIENYQNYMDYSYCSMMFTAGQKARMRIALEMPEADRNNLWSDANSIATGTDVPTAQLCTPKADFHTNSNFVCEGASMTFYDASSNASIINRSWTFNNATPATSTAKNPVTVFNTAGWQAVSLTASNSTGSDTETKNSFVFVSPSWTDYYGTFSEGFEDETLFNNQWFVVNHENNLSKWEISKSASYSGSASLFINNTYNQPFPLFFPIYPGIGRGDIDDVISPSYDLSNVTSMNLNFKLSCATYASFSSDINEVLKVYYSVNCGQTWTLLKTEQGPSLANAGFCGTVFIPNSTASWKQESISLPAGVSNSNVRFKFQYSSGNYSNNLYIDDLNISGTVGIDKNSIENMNLSVFPNPTGQNESATISYHLPVKQNVKIDIVDAIGRHIKELINEPQDGGDHTINIQNLNAGIYSIRLAVGNNYTVRKLVITN